MNAIEKLGQSAADFSDDPRSAGYALRLDLAALVIRAMKRRGWSQQKLADEAGMKPAFVCRIVNAESNCTFETAGRLLFALGETARLVEPQTTASTDDDHVALTLTRSCDDHGEEIHAVEKRYAEA